MQDEGKLDITSDPRPSRPAETKAQQPAKAQNSLRVFFKCCRVYAYVNIPEAVQQGRLSSWRFHCPRCGNLIEIPL